MTAGAFTADEILQMQRIQEQQLVCTYSRLTKTQDATQVDEWYDPVVTDSAVVDNVPCLFVYGSTTAIQPASDVVAVQKPTLVVKLTDTLKAGDVVTNVRGMDGAMLDAGPFAVDSVMIMEPILPIFKVAVLVGP